MIFLFILTGRGTLSQVIIKITKTQWIFLENSVAKSNGYVVAIVNERVLNSNSCSRHELIKALRDNKSTGKDSFNIIPFVTKEFIVEQLVKDNELKALVSCGIQYLEGNDREKQCEEIVQRAVAQLMTPGSIKVLADNLMKGTFRKPNPEEANFLYSLLSTN